MLERLDRHHLGFVVAAQDMAALEDRYGKPFVFDPTQGCHVLFVDDAQLQTRIEFVTNEGRAANLKPGFAHICYNVRDMEHFGRVEAHIAKNKLGYALTALERSGAEECGRVAFFFIKELGLVEFNVPD